MLQEEAGNIQVVAETGGDERGLVGVQVVQGGVGGARQHEFYHLELVVRCRPGNREREREREREKEREREIDN